ncbi:NADH-quinone oxidoreductase subunit N [Myroides ceti]|uniref:NADH-quinone oxidoreductase subunit N n=1 Tax=Paenimyroides ceti TaxID=395087 RepID=A0ABT8CXB0_9FLAO|nr:NADH-quinone oxidoreductase subunit N [Paenimyroides ceti]MDN3708511.1 NADH-quinone oxidoreductase subunit N [Paenimyroides ceti]MDN3708870.1 NADH-quinone oxidoreductase subunit N [Paenimyroides ceti]
MNTLIALAGLAVLILVLEIINLRKIIVPLTIIGLLAALGISICDMANEAGYYHNMIVVNKSNMLYTSLFIVLTVFIVMLSEDFYKPHYDKISDYVSLKIFLLIGAVSMVTFGNLTMFFIGLEILSITLYILAGSDRTDVKSNESGMKYFLMGSFASGFVLFGIALVYGATASFDMNTISNSLTAVTAPTWLYLGIVLICIGMLFKIAAFPFHFWAPDVYQGAPMLTTTIMSTLAKVVAVATFYKLLTAFQPILPENFHYLLVFLAIATMCVGNVMALRQENIKRMLAYSGISHAGFMMIALLVIENANANLFYYASAYALSGIAAFAVIMSVCSKKEDELIKHFKGLGKKKPVLAAVLTMALLSMAGIPVFAGFFGKFFLLNNALENGYITLVIFGVVNSIISIYYYFKVISAMYSQSAETEEPEVTNSAIYQFVAVLAITLNIIIGIYPALLLDLF